MCENCLIVHKNNPLGWCSFRTQHYSAYYFFRYHSSTGERYERSTTVRILVSVIYSLILYTLYGLSFECYNSFMQIAKIWQDIYNHSDCNKGIVVCLMILPGFPISFIFYILFLSLLLIFEFITN